MNFSDNKFYYNRLTEEIAQDIELCLCEGIKSKDVYRYWEYPIEILDKSQAVYVKWQVIRSKNMKQQWDLYGFAGPNESYEPSIEIIIFLKPGIWQSKANIDGGSLRNVISHELHHLAQNIETDPPKDCYEYFVCEHEAEAFRMGFRAQSNFSGIPESTLMERYLQPRVDNGELSIRQIDKIMDRWLNVDWRLVNARN